MRIDNKTAVMCQMLLLIMIFWNYNLMRKWICGNYTEAYANHCLVCCGFSQAGESAVWRKEKTWRRKQNTLCRLKGYNCIWTGKSDPTGRWIDISPWHLSWWGQSNFARPPAPVSMPYISSVLLMLKSCYCPSPSGAEISSIRAI